VPPFRLVGDGGKAVALAAQDTIGVVELRCGALGRGEALQGVVVSSLRAVAFGQG
jgi:hypothetical protein